MNKNYSWAIEDIYDSIEAWEKDFKYVEENLDFSMYKGKLSSCEQFLQCMKKDEKLSRVFEKLSVYAMMKHDEDTSNSVYDSLLSRVTMLSSVYGAKTSFIMPEITALSTETINSYIENASFSDYDYFLKTVLKKKEHVLSENEEKILAEVGEPLSSFHEIFTKIDNADLPLTTIKYNGEEFPLTHGTYGMYMQSQDREFRRLVFDEYYKSYISLINTISAVYYGSIKSDVFCSKTRKYDSALSGALIREDVPTIVYKNLIDSVSENVNLLHEYLAEKKKTLNLSEMHMYDVYVPTVPGAELKLDFDRAYQLVVDGLSILGNDYVDLLNKAREERWIDVYEKPNKRSGAYSVAVYDTHPYVLLNYQQTTHDVFTIAHELGHSIHSYYSNKNQPYQKADYKIFVAEVASTVNEILLIKHLLKTATDNKLKKYLLSYLMEMIRATLFRQTQFAEFEEFAHASVESGIPLTKDNMCEKYLEINKKYYGNSVISDDNIKYEWARIPHFYRAFYVYKYSTGIISAMSIVNRMLTEGQTAIDDYFKFLSSGNSDGPVELLKIAGVDLTKRNAFDGAFEVFRDALESFKKL